jgi:p-aminobenzoyl-glutamate transporter AbgT
MSAAEVAPASSQKGILGWIERTGTKTVITTANLLSADNIQSLWVEMPKTFTHFHPLGYVLVVMRGRGCGGAGGPVRHQHARGCARWPQPYSIGLMVVGLGLAIGWVVLDVPLGPGASVFIAIPGEVAPAASAPIAAS